MFVLQRRKEEHIYALFLSPPTLLSGEIEEEGISREYCKLFVCIVHLQLLALALL